MALNFSEKEIVVAQVSELAQQSISVIAAKYEGLTAGQMTQLRAQARAQKVRLQVVPNALARRAFKDTHVACMDKSLVGPLVLAFSTEAPSDAARVIKEFANTNQRLQVTAIALSGQLYGPERLAFVASLPTRDEAIAQLMSVMKAPITKLVQTLNAVPQKLVRTVDAVREQKSASA